MTIIKSSLFSVGLGDFLYKYVMEFFETGIQILLYLSITIHVREQNENDKSMKGGVSSVCTLPQNIAKPKTVTPTLLESTFVCLTLLHSELQKNSMEFERSESIRVKYWEILQPLIFHFRQTH